MVKVLIGLIRFYQGFISPFKRSCCRFYPTCSEYATEAIREYGLFSGAFLALKRLLKCHPFHPGGYDPLNPDRHGSQMYGKGMKGIEKVAGVYPLNPLTPLNPLAPPNPFNHP